MQTFFFPGWAVPSAYYEKQFPEADHVLDYGFYSEKGSFAKAEIDQKEPCVIMAHSLGSMFALEQAAAKQNVKALVLFTPFARFSECDDYPGQPVNTIKAMIAQLKRRPKRLLENFFENMAAPEDFKIEIPDYINTEALIEGLNCLLEYDVRNCLEHIDSPVLLVSGGQDMIAAHGQADALQAALKNCQRLHLPDTGHALPFTCRNRYAGDWDTLRSSMDKKLCRK